MTQRSRENQQPMEEHCNGEQHDSRWAIVQLGQESTKQQTNHSHSKNDGGRKMRASVQRGQQNIIESYTGASPILS